MTKGPITNMAASVHQRLLNLSKATDRRFIDVLQHYALERWLYRVSQTRYRDRCFLKGALLLVVWNAPSSRPTRDIDLLVKLSNDLDIVRSIIAEICEAPVIDDGLIFDSSTVVTHRIAQNAHYEGVRAAFKVTLGSARISMQVDMGFSDIITPAPESIEFPSILDHPSAALLAYNRESVVAEKFEAMVKLGVLNSRMKDFYDVALLARSYDFSESNLAAAVRATFAHRGSRLEAAPVCFSRDFEQDQSKSIQWKAFLKRSAIEDAPAEFAQIVGQVRAFLRPVVEQVVMDDRNDRFWAAGGPWQHLGR